MNKTIFQIDYKLSVLIISILGIVIGFITNIHNVIGATSVLFYFIKCIVLCGLYLVFYLVENKNDQFKMKTKYIFGNLLLLIMINMVMSVFVASHILAHLFLSINGLISLYIILFFTCEILSLYLDNSLLTKFIDFNKKIGSAIANPITTFFERKITND